MTTVKAQKIPKKEVNIDNLLYIFCYYYPAYTYKMASELPYVRVINMIKIARSEQAKLFNTLLSIAVAPHAKKGYIQKFRSQLKALEIDI